MHSVKDELLSEIDKLSSEQQAQVLAYTRNLQITLPPGTPGEDLVQLVHELNFTADDLAEMEAAIEAGCERIDWNEW